MPEKPQEGVGAKPQYERPAIRELTEAELASGPIHDAIEAMRVQGEAGQQEKK